MAECIWLSDLTRCQPAEAVSREKRTGAWATEISWKNGKEKETNTIE